MANTFTYFPELFKAGYIDTLQKRVDLYNQSTNGVITLAAQDAEGVLQREKFMKRSQNIVKRADRDSDADASVVTLDEDEFKRAFIDGLAGPFETGELERMAAGRPMEEVNEALGAMVGEAVFEDYTESLMSACIGALTSNADLTFSYEDGSADLKTMEPDALNQGMGLFGDQRRDLQLILMHSAVETQLIDFGINAASDPIVARGALEGQPATLRKPYITADLDALTITDGTGSITGYRTLILRTGGAGVEEVKQAELVESGNQFLNRGITRKVGGDYRFNVKVQGFSFNDSVANPTEAELADTANWSYVMTDKKLAAGVVIETAA